MRIKNLIRRWFGRSVIVIESSPEIYVADMTNRSKNVRGIEITDHQQPSPDGKGMMDCLVFHNPNILSVDCCIFNDHDFKIHVQERMISIVKVVCILHCTILPVGWSLLKLRIVR